MKNILLFITGLLGATGVALGALGAHALKAKVALGEMTSEQLTAFDTGTKYQLMHSIVLLVLVFYNSNKQYKWLTRASYLIITGVLFFSGSIYLLTTRGITGIGGISFLGPITPVGGLLLISGWICITLQALQKNDGA